ncbi:OmpA family protein [bacterium]|nr:OmpA family protein [bacterium]
MKRWFLKISIAILVFFSQVNAGKYVANFLDMGAGARALGMGKAFTASADDVTAVWWNPSGLAQINFHQLNLMHSTLYKELYNYDTGCLTLPLMNGTLGLGIMRLATEDIPFTRDDMFYDWGPDQLPGTNDPGEGNGIRDSGEPIIPVFDYKGEANTAFFVGYALPLFSKVFVGGNFKFIRQDIGEFSSMGFGGDLGALYNHNENLKFGILLQDITGTHLRWSTETWESKFPTLKIGASYSKKLPEWGTLNLNCDLETKFENIKTGSVLSIGTVSIDTYLGGEFWLKDIFALRTGLERKYLTAGAGLKIKFFQVDYAFLSHEIEQTHRISVTVNLSRPRLSKEAVQPVEEEVQVHIIQKSVKKEIDIPEQTDTTTKEVPDLLGELIGEVNFPTGKAIISDNAYPVLRNAAKLLEDYPEYRLKISGHTDNRTINTDEFPSNNELSKARAQVVADYLISSFNIERSRLVIEGFGFKQPKVPNDSPKNMAINRRVEIYLIE